MLVNHEKLHIVSANKRTAGTKTGPEVIKNSCSTHMSMKIFLLINVKVPTIIGILTFMSRKNSIPGKSEPEEAGFFVYVFILMSI